MSLRTTTCHVVRCDGCGDEEFGADYIHHFANAAEAADHATENDVFSTSDGRHYCDYCIEKGKAPADVLEAVEAKREGERRAMEEFEARRRRAGGQG